MSDATRRLIVTGGGSGIGRAVCAAAVTRGWSVAAVDHDADGLAKSSTDLGISTFRCDVTDELAVVSTMAAAAEVIGPPDALVSAAGVYVVQPAQETSADDFLRVVQINTVGSFITAKACAQLMREAGSGGAIVLLSSMAAITGDASEPGVAYVASKGAVEAMTRQLAVEWAPHNIRVNAVSPGVIDTPMLRLMDDPVSGQQYIDDGVPLGRLGTADEVANACLFLIDQVSGYVTGTVLRVDGGATII